MSGSARTVADSGTESLSNGRSVRWAFGSARDGDLSVRAEPSALDDRRQAQQPGQWLWLHQVHGNAVVDLRGRSDVENVNGENADGALTDQPDVVLSVVTADCCPLLMWSDSGTIAAVHAGWRGLVGGAVEAAIAAVGPGSPLFARLGPCICPLCYEFGEGDLAIMASRFGALATTQTRWGTPALDVRAVIRHICDSKGVALIGPEPQCTACDDGYFSHRARADNARQAATITLLTAPESAGDAASVEVDGDRP